MRSSVFLGCPSFSAPSEKTSFVPWFTDSYLVFLVVLGQTELVMLISVKFSAAVWLFGVPSVSTMPSALDYRSRERGSPMPSFVSLLDKTVLFYFCRARS